MTLLYPQDAEAGAALLTLAECRMQCRVDADDEDELLLTLAAAAERHVEAFTGRRLTVRDVTAVADRWPDDGVWRVMLAPVRQVLGIDYDDAAGAAQSLPAGSWTLRQRVDASEIVLHEPLPALAPRSLIRVRLEAGYEIGSCEPDLKAAVLVQLAWLFDSRGSGVEAATQRTVEGLMDRWRMTKAGM